jgi:hypothetical protein
MDKIISISKYKAKDIYSAIKTASTTQPTALF